MKRTVRIFIGSSSENSMAIESLSKVLSKSRKTDFKIKPAPWNKGVFKFSAAYIESLEKELNKADFAILELTPNDVTRIRNAKVKTPRDNVLFELGLFMGRLHRERCIMLYARDDKPKLPTDLLGIKAATYGTSKSDNLESALLPVAQQIVNHVAEVLSRPTLSAFIAQIEGAWWERIQAEKGKELSFFTIRPINKYQSIEMGGDHYSARGKLIGSWEAIETAIRYTERELFYHWEGQHPPKKDHEVFKVKGFGTLRFNYASGLLELGKGDFLDFYPGHKEETQWKTVRLKRVQNQKHITTMKKGSRDAKKALISEILKHW